MSISTGEENSGCGVVIEAVDRETLITFRKIAVPLMATEMAGACVLQGGARFNH